HGVAEHAGLALLVADGARDGEPGVDPDPQREVATGALGDAFVLAVERSEDRKRGPLGARGMIDLVVDRAEYRDDGVADVLLDESVERPDLDRDRVPGGAHVFVELFRVSAGCVSTSPVKVTFGPLDERWRGLTAGLVLNVTFVAFEALAIATIMPLVVADLGGVALYGWVFSAFLLADLVGIVLAGEL